MDYLDTKKQFRQHVILFVGYGCVAIAIVIAALILLYQANGFGIGHNGKVIQNGLTFVSSQPRPANIYINGKLYKSGTNTRLTQPEGIYKLTLARQGYNDWQRTIEVDGGSLRHFDYPLLIPKSLATKTINSYNADPGLVTQSPDRRWLVVQKPASTTEFEVYDLKNPTKAVATVTLPAQLLTKATASESLQLVEWSDDNQHVLVQHIYDDKSEYIMVDRVNPSQSVNLSNTLSLNSAKPSLKNKKYDSYYLYDQAAATLQTASLKNPTPVTLLQHVLAYKSYSDDTLLYATDATSKAGTVDIRLQSGSRTAAIRSLPAGGTYLLDLAKYSGALYVVAGANTSDRVYTYQDPFGQLNDQPDHAVVPAQVLHVDHPNYVSFSSNAQFIVAESGQHFALYDAENKIGYNYTSDLPLDAPALHATWMDGDRLTYASGGKQVIFDYDKTNPHVLAASAADHLAAFTPNYHYAYTLAPSATDAGQYDLLQTALLVPGDL